MAALVRAGANVNARDKNGYTPLHNAMSNKNPEVAIALIRAGADVNAKDNGESTPLLHMAIPVTSIFNPEVVNALIEAGTDLNAKGKSGQTALDYAERYTNRKEMAALLRKAGALTRSQLDSGSQPQKQAKQKQTAASSFHALCKNGTAAKIEDAVAGGADVNARDANGWTPLMYAARYNSRADAVSALIAGGADVSAAANDGNSALTLAKKNKNQAVYLLINDYAKNRPAAASNASQSSGSEENSLPPGVKSVDFFKCRACGATVTQTSYKDNPMSEWSDKIGCPKNIRNTAETTFWHDLEFVKKIQRKTVYEVD
jgi:ankyrin repeat protein